MKKLLLSQKDFAGLIGKSPARVSQVSSDLVFSGRKVDVVPSIEKLKNHPTLQLPEDVMIRVDMLLDGNDPDDGEQEDIDEVCLDVAQAKKLKAISEARKQAALADQEEMERDKMAGSLMALEDVEYVLNDVAKTFRYRIETLADRLSPLVYPLSTLEETHNEISETAAQILTDVNHAFEKAAKRMSS